MSNRAEAAAVVRLVSRLRAAGVRARSIGVICFFRAQVEVVRRLLLENQAQMQQMQAQQRPVVVSAAGAEEAEKNDKAKEEVDDDDEKEEKDDAADDDDEIPTVATVDSYQGCEKDLIIITTAATRPSAFTRDAHRVNVAVTRARRHLVVVGHGGALVAAAAAPGGGGGAGAGGRAAGSGGGGDANALGAIVRACSSSPGGVLEMV